MSATSNAIFAASPTTPRCSATSASSITGRASPRRSISFTSSITITPATGASTRPASCPWGRSSLSRQFLVAVASAGCTLERQVCYSVLYSRGSSKPYHPIGADREIRRIEHRRLDEIEDRPVNLRPLRLHQVEDEFRRAVLALVHDANGRIRSRRQSP